MNPWAELEQTIKRIIPLLAGLGLRFHITGGLVSSFYGEPRYTQDVDIVIRLSGDREETRVLTEALAQSFLIDPEAIVRAVSRQDMFQALDAVNCVRIDLHVGEGITGELDRSVMKEFYPGVMAPIASKEDAILSKLIWIAKGSHKSRQDVVSMMRNPEPIDWDALRERAADLHVTALLDEMHRDAFGR